MPSTPFRFRPRRGAASAASAVLASLCLALLAGHAAAQTPAPAAGKPHPLLGTWRWTLPGKACQESLDFRADGTRAGTSGEETTSASYTVSTVPSLLGFYRLAEVTTQSNGQRDCAGDLHDVSGEEQTRFLQFSPKLDMVIICQSESLKACYGPLRRGA